MDLLNLIFWQVPVGDYTIPLGVAKVVREGTDVTLVGWGGQMNVLKKVLLNVFSLQISYARELYIGCRAS